MEIIPKNHRKKWSEIEVNQLLNEIKSKLSIEKIAKNHNRTVKAVIYKFIRHLIYLSNDKKIKKIKLNLNEEDLLIIGIPKMNLKLNLIISFLGLIFFLQFIICIL